MKKKFLQHLACPRVYNSDNRAELAEAIVNSWDMDTLMQYAIEHVFDDMEDKNSFYDEWEYFHEGLDFISVGDLQGDEYVLIQTDDERKAVEEHLGISEHYIYYIVKAQDGEYIEVYGTDSPKLDAQVDILFYK